MKTTDWNYDFTSLPLWDIREKFWDAHDRFFEIPQSDTLCCIYSIYEITMCNNLGRMVILKNKQSPQLVAQCSYPFHVNFSVSDDGRLIFLQPCLYDQEFGIKTPILVIDLVENRFSYVLTDSISSWHSVKQKNSDVFVVNTQEYNRSEQRHIEIPVMEFQIQPLQWYDLNKLSSLREMIFPEEPEKVAPRKGIWNYLSVGLDIAMVLLALINISFGKATFIDYLIILGQILIVFPVYLAVHKHKR